MDSLSTLPGAIQIALVVLLVLIGWAILKRMVKVAVVVAILVLVIVGLWVMLGG